MLKSMTGFGRSDVSFDGQMISVEVSAVNHRFLDLSVKMPPAWYSLEPAIREFLRSKVSRGKMSVMIRRRGTASQPISVHFDAEAARQYIDASRKLSDMLGIKDELSLNVLARMEGVFVTEEPEDNLDAARDILIRAVGMALENLDAMRVAEGKALETELRERIAIMRQALADIEVRLPQLNAEYTTKLRSRIQELAADVAVTEERIAIEVAFHAERSDVTEEVVRLKAHFAHAEELFESKEPTGRQLNFLVQEMQREANTLGTKARDTAVGRDVLQIKSEIEKVREQVQNLE